MAPLNLRKDVLTFAPTSQNCNCPQDQCCSKYGYSGNDDAHCGDGCQAGPCTTPANDVSGVILWHRSFFDGIQNQASADCPGKGFYRRDTFLNALNSFPRFGKTGSVDDSKREIAAFWAHVTHETGYMCFIGEKDKSNNYCTSPAYQCAEGKSYYGRGPLQLTGNGNYGAAGDALNFDGINAPETVAQDPVLSFKTALRFWMTNVNTVVNQGFGATINAINGSVECNGRQPAQVQHRVLLYIQYCSKFSVDPGPNLSCWVR